MRFALLSIAAAGIVALSLPAFSSSVTPQPLATRANELHVLEPDEVAATESAHFMSLERYVLDEMLAWAPASTIVGTHSTEGFEPIAHDIVSVVLDPGEPAIFPDDAEKAKTATLLTAIAYWEGHYWPYVDSGLCNKPEERDNPLLQNGGCDSGEAVSLWQIHPGRGIVLFDNGLYGYRTKPLTDKGPQGVVSASAALLSPPPVAPLSVSAPVDAEALGDRRVAAKTALHMLRASLKHNGTLCEYTGELRLCPKAVKRLKFAVEWSAAHPYGEHHE